MKTKIKLVFLLVFLLAVGLGFVYFRSQQLKPFLYVKNKEEQPIAPAPTPQPTLDVRAYDQKLMEIANNPIVPSSSASSTLNLKPNLWPVKTVYPNYGALLPFNRIVAYYGNLYSQNMGVLGEYPEEEMLKRLSVEVKKWQAADPSTPVIPALHYIAIVAQAGPGRDGLYRARMPHSEIDKVVTMAQKINPATFCQKLKDENLIPEGSSSPSSDEVSTKCGASALVFLDIQIGLSNVQTEVPLLEKYLKLPNVHLGIDPEFAMEDGEKPGTVIGSLDASDINFAAEYLAKIAKENNLPPKILIIHRFTQNMVTNYKQITPLEDTQVIMDMDGFGSQGSKLNTYKQYIYKQPVQFTGFKLFYKNDTAVGPILEPEDLLKLNPIPLYIQFQ